MRLTTLFENKNKLTLIDLPYAENALNPVLGKDTVKFHYSTLSKGYVDRYNKSEGDSTFNKAGALLHNYYWQNLKSPSNNNAPTGKIKELIEESFDTFADFKAKFTAKSMALQGSGWCYLSKSGSIKTIENHKWEDDILLLIDLWEHAYDPYTTRKEYLKTIWKIVNWEFINTQLDSKA